ncbi:MAG: AAA family ATPase [Microcoleus sp. CSU_2_2]|nr:AAA family ATPase [Microcoleus sp. CSU_2_2]
MINSIHIKGFRGIESGSMNKFRQFNIFVGANNAGKSAVMEAIYLASTVDREVGLLREDDDGQRSNAVLLSTVDLLGNNPFKLIAGKHGDLGDLLNLSRIGEAFLIVDVADSKSPLQEFELDIGKSKLSIENIALFAFDSSKENEDLAKLIWQDVGANGHSPLLLMGVAQYFVGILASRTIAKEVPVGRSQVNPLPPNIPFLRYIRCPKLYSHCLLSSRPQRSTGLDVSHCRAFFCDF